MRDEDVARAAYLAFAVLREDMPGWLELEEAERRYYTTVVRKNAHLVKSFGPGAMYAEAERGEGFTDETGMLTRCFAAIIWAYSA